MKNSINFNCPPPFKQCKQAEYQGIRKCDASERRRKKKLKLLIEYLLMIGLSSRTLECSPQFAKSCGAALEQTNESVDI